jgi:hypothetical protein
MRPFIFTGLFLTMATGSLASETFDMNGTAKGVSKPQMHQNSQGHVIAGLHSTLTPELTDSRHPYYAMTGDCTGHLIIKETSAHGAGMCAYSNPAGDTALIEYSINSLTQDGGFRGTWVSLGGTGKTAGISGGGTWVNSAVAEDGTFTQSAAGAVWLP